MLRRIIFFGNSISHSISYLCWYEDLGSMNLHEEQIAQPVVYRIRKYFFCKLHPYLCKRYFSFQFLHLLQDLLSIRLLHRGIYRHVWHFHGSKLCSKTDANSSSTLVQKWKFLKIFLKLFWSIPDSLSSSVMFIKQAAITLLEIETSSVNSIQRFAISTSGDIVRTLWKTVATVVAKSAKSLIFLKPQNQDFEISEFSSLLFSGDSIDTHHVHQSAFDVIFFSI